MNLGDRTVRETVTNLHGLKLTRDTTVNIGTMVSGQRARVTRVGSLTLDECEKRIARLETQCRE